MYRMYKIKSFRAFKDQKVHSTEEPLENLCTFDKDSSVY